MQLLLTVDFLHTRDIIHRDLKPENVLISFTSPKTKLIHVKIMDFGIAETLMKDEEQLMLVCGTPTYIAPEVLKKHGYGLKADIFAIGSILFNLITA